MNETPPVAVPAAGDKPIDEIKDEKRIEVVDKNITLAALLNILEPTIYLSIFHQLSQYEYEAATRGTVEELRAGRCAEVCGDNIIRKIIVDTVMRPVDKSGPGLALDVVIGRKEHS